MNDDVSDQAVMLSKDLNTRGIAGLIDFRGVVAKCSQSGQQSIRSLNYYHQFLRSSSSPKTAFIQVVSGYFL